MELIKWTDDEIKLLKENYYNNTNKELSILLNKSRSTIIRQIKKLKDKNEIKPKITPVSKWTDKEIQYLIKNFSDIENIKISQILNKTISQIRYKATQLNLKKSKKHRQKMRIKNSLSKEGTRRLTYDVVLNIAKKYKNRNDFQQHDCSAYITARNNDWIEKVCSHMTKQNYSTPQLILRYIISKIINTKLIYNDRKKNKTIRIRYILT